MVSFNCLKKTVLSLVLLVSFTGMIGAAEENSSAGCLTPKAFYFYPMLTTIKDVSVYYWLWEEVNKEENSGVGWLLGIGYTFARLGSRTWANVEFDINWAIFKKNLIVNPRSRFYVVMLSMEHRISSQFPLSVYAGLGGGKVHYVTLPHARISRFDEDTQALLTFDFGLKAGMTKNLLWRMQLRNYWKFLKVREYFSEAYRDYEGLKYLGFSFAMGVELHFSRL